MSNVAVGMRLFAYTHAQFSLLDTIFIHSTFSPTVLFICLFVCLFLSPNEHKELGVSVEGGEGVKGSFGAVSKQSFFFSFGEPVVYFLSEGLSYSCMSKLTEVLLGEQLDSSTAWAWFQQSYLTVTEHRYTYVCIQCPIIEPIIGFMIPVSQCN